MLATIRSLIIVGSMAAMLNCVRLAHGAELQFNRDVRPILAENCFHCHGPDSASRKADLRLDRREAAIEMGALTPGDPEKSTLIDRILSADAELMMPPPASHKKLTLKQKEILTRWVREGANYQPHWSFLKPESGSMPTVKNESWIRNPIDRFILARLEQEGLTPNAEADRRTLARRLSLDLTGLPADPARVDRFVGSSDPNAYEQYVDELLSMPQYGEHRARYWLDAARYADTHGIHFDNQRDMWSYRDWVIAAFNKNMPFDQFTTEQLAGDLLPDVTLDQRIATGFNRCNITTNEGGTIDEEYLVLYTRDRTETTATVWMGLTMNCSTCHDHKFDPITQREFYEMAAFFNNTTQAAKDGNIKETPPIVVVPKMEDRDRWGELQQELEVASRHVDLRRTEARPLFETWAKSATADDMKAYSPANKLALYAPLNEGSGASTRVQIGEESRSLSIGEPTQWIDGPAGSKGVQLAGGQFEPIEFGDFADQGFSFSAWIRIPANESTGAICSKMSVKDNYQGWDFWLEQRQIGTHIVSKWSDDALKVVARAKIPADRWTHVAVTYDGSKKAAGVKIYYDGKLQQNNASADRLKGSIATTAPFRLGERTGGSPLHQVGLQELRVYSRMLLEGEVGSLAKNARLAGILSKPVEKRSPQELNELYDWWISNLDGDYLAKQAVVAGIQKQQNEIKSRGTVAHVMQEKASNPEAFVLYRGEYDKRRDPVTADTPKILPPFPEGSSRNRLGVAQWLLSPEHPLTARVTVNRFWQEVFGTGIVRTTGDFGVTGELPSHQELLDWLAVDFRTSGWDVKRFFKQLVMSAAYRQSAQVTLEKLEKDPPNRLLSRGPRFRLDAEVVRDSALAASGLLVRQIGGPSVKPYQPEGVWEAVAMIGSNTRDYRRDTGDSLYRRSMYTFWKRSAPPALMEIFNAPSRELCVVRRERTNTPLQALATLNDPQFVEAARVLAELTIAKAEGTDESRIDFMMRQLLARPATNDEKTILKDSVTALTAYYGSHAAEAARLIAVGEKKASPELKPELLATWTMIANELLNLDEFVCK